MLQDDGDGRVAAGAIRRPGRIESARVFLEHVHEQFEVALIIAFPEFVVEAGVAFRNFAFVDSLLAQSLSQLYRFGLCTRTGAVSTFFVRA